MPRPSTPKTPPNRCASRTRIPTFRHSTKSSSANPADRFRTNCSTPVITTANRSWNPRNKTLWKICLSQRRIDEIKNVCRKYGNDPGELINILHGVQDTLGYLPKEVQELIALELGISAARVYGVVSFYSFFTMKPKGKYPISVCMGTACYVRGGEKVLDEFRRQLGIEVGGTTPDGLFSLDSLRCVGACGLAPVVMIGPRVYGRLKVTDVKGILDEIQALEKRSDDAVLR